MLILFVSARYLLCAEMLLLLPGIVNGFWSSTSSYTAATRPWHHNMVSSVEQQPWVLVDERHYPRTQHVHRGKTALVTDYSDTSRRVDSAFQEIDWKRYSSLQAEIQSVQRRLVDEQESWQTRFQNHQEQVLEHHCQLEDRMHELDQEREKFEAFLNKEGLQYRMGIGQEHSTTMQQIKEQEAELQLLQSLRDETKREMLDWQCETLRRQVQIEMAQGNLETEKAERAQEKREHAQTLMIKTQVYQARIKQATEARRSNLTAISANFTIQLREAECCVIQLRKDIRRGRLDIPSLDARILKLEQDQASLKSVSLTLTFLLTRRFYEYLFRPLGRLLWGVFGFLVWNRQPVQNQRRRLVNQLDRMNVQLKPVMEKSLVQFWIVLQIFYRHILRPTVRLTWYLLTQSARNLCNLCSTDGRKGGE